MRIARQLYLEEEDASMERYKDIDNDSGVEAYEIGSDFINVKFQGIVKVYKYSYASAGQQHIEKMKFLAANGEDLNAYINKHVKYKYVR